MTHPIQALPLPTGRETNAPSYAPSQQQVDLQIRNSAQEFEAVFLTEMLKHAGLAKMPETFNGGVGEAAFADFLAREYATEIAKTRSIGIADQIAGALKGGQTNDNS